MGEARPSRERYLQSYKEQERRHLHTFFLEGSNVLGENHSRVVFQEAKPLTGRGHSVGLPWTDRNVPQVPQLNLRDFPLTNGDIVVLAKSGLSLNIVTAKI